MSSEAPVQGEIKGYCRNCGTPLMAETMREVRGILYCEPCLANAVAEPQVVPGAPNPALAALLGFVPGLGAVYNGEYMKGVVHFLIFVGLVTLAAHGGPQPMTGMFIGGLFVYMPIEAYQTAKARILGQKPVSPFGATAMGLPWGALLLIGLGVLLLLDKLRLLDLERIADYIFPLVLIAIGAFLVWKRTSGGSSSGATNHEQRD